MGPVANPDAIGAQIRLKFGEQFGPAREIHAGAGYWSQDSVVQVLGAPRPATLISVRWPGGKTVLAPVPEGAREIAVDYTGQVTPPLNPPPSTQRSANLRKEMSRRDQCHQKTGGGSVGTGTAPFALMVKLSIQCRSLALRAGAKHKGVRVEAAKRGKAAEERVRHS
jgi:hypothetical protein